PTTKPRNPAHRSSLRATLYHTRLATPKSAQFRVDSTADASPRQKVHHSHPPDPARARPAELNVQSENANRAQNSHPTTTNTDQPHPPRVPTHHKILHPPDCRHRTNHHNPAIAANVPANHSHPDCPAQVVPPVFQSN